jgi:hypothetical protein
MPGKAVVLGALLGLGLTATRIPGQDPADFPAAVYVMKIQAGDPGRIPPGEYFVSFDGHGVFEVQRDTTVLVTGAYVSQGDTLQVEDEEGPNACVPPDVRGSYRWTVNQGNLSLKLLNDACRGWRTTLALRPMLRKP